MLAGPQPGSASPNSGIRPRGSQHSEQGLQPCKEMAAGWLQPAGARPAPELPALPLGGDGDGPAAGFPSSWRGGPGNGFPCAHSTFSTRHGAPAAWRGSNRTWLSDVPRTEKPNKSTTARQRPAGSRARCTAGRTAWGAGGSVVAVPGTGTGQERAARGRSGGRTRPFGNSRFETPLPVASRGKRGPGEALTAAPEPVPVGESGPSGRAARRSGAPPGGTDVCPRTRVPAPHSPTYRERRSGDALRPPGFVGASPSRDAGTAGRAAPPGLS